MTFLSVSIISLYSLCTVHGLKIVWDNSVNLDFEYKVLEGNDNEVVEMHMPNRQFIYPGTKWCGQGDIAENENDLGTWNDTDKCCRTHDMCPDTMEGYQTKYNLTNSAFYTKLSCQCDTEFYECLKTVDSFVSNQVGTIYFTVLGTQCFKESYPITDCTDYSYFPSKKCLQYSFDETQTKQYQWFDIPNY